jgi:hypothetical protein
MAFLMSVGLQNDLVGRMLTNLAGTSGTAGYGRLRIYSGTQPGTAGYGTSGTMLVQIDGICWDTATSGTANLTSISGYLGTSVAAGVARWGRLEGSSGISGLIIDGDVGVDFWNVFTINSIDIETSQVISLLNADIIAM